MSERLNIALIGAGQLGGSFALALREAGADVHITAYDANQTNAEILRERGAVDATAASAAAAAKGADIIMLATPLRTYRTLAAEIAPVLAPHAIVTDLGSVKSSMAQLASVLPAARLVPGHPIAGGEQSGAAVARGDLFRGKLCILTPDEASDGDAIDTVETLWHIAGADVLRMPVPVHDSIYAYVSHLPHLIAFVAARALYQEGVRVQSEQQVLQQFLRISRSNPRMWVDVFLENREALLPALGTYIAVLEHFAKELRSGTTTDAAMHPQLVAANFLPRILAGSLISSVSLYEQQAETTLRPFGAGGMRDIVAPAAIDPEADLEAISNNAIAVAQLLERVIPLFRAVENLIGAEDEPQLFAEISSMVTQAHALISSRQ